MLCRAIGNKKLYISSIKIINEQEMNMTENLVSAMHPELQDRYVQLKEFINEFIHFNIQKRGILKIMSFSDIG